MYTRICVCVYACNSFVLKVAVGRAVSGVSAGRRAYESSLKFKSLLPTCAQKGTVERTVACCRVIITIIDRPVGRGRRP